MALNEIQNVQYAKSEGDLTSLSGSIARWLDVEPQKVHFVPSELLGLKNPLVSYDLLFVNCLVCRAADHLLTWPLITALETLSLTLSPVDTLSMHPHCIWFCSVVRVYLEEKGFDLFCVFNTIMFSPQNFGEIIHLTWRCIVVLQKTLTPDPRSGTTCCVGEICTKAFQWKICTKTFQ